MRSRRPGRLPVDDVLRVGAVGLRTRPVRALLSALGIAIGIGAMIAVVGISASGRADLRRTLDGLGTNMLTVTGGDAGPPGDGRLPDTATPMIERIAPVLNAAAVSKLSDGVHAYRNDRVPAHQTNGILIYAADLDLPVTLGATLAHGAWLDSATAAFPAVVLGADAARRLGIARTGPAVLVQIGDERFTVIGVLDPLALAPELDGAALVGTVAAQRYLGDGYHPTAVYLRAVDEQVTAVRDVLAATAAPEAPYLVAVSRPSDALTAKLATQRALNSLVLGLGAVALVVGGVGVANTMVISVLERRTEIGLRRALGATRNHIRLQFLTESLLLTALGGLGGAALGVAVTAGYAYTRAWPAVLPGWSVAAGAAAVLTVGVVAGLYPAIRAAHLSPTEALTST